MNLLVFIFEKVLEAPDCTLHKMSGLLSFYYSAFEIVKKAQGDEGNVMVGV